MSWHEVYNYRKVYKSSRTYVRFMVQMSANGDLLTEQQLNALLILQDGEWHDRRDIHSKLRFKKYNYSIISERIIKPLEEIGLIEQEERPGTKKKFVRIRIDLDDQGLQELHSLIMFSANELDIKYMKKDKERADFFRAVVLKSDKKLGELEKLEEERRQRSKEEFWRNKESSIPYSESWPKLIAMAKAIADRFENALKPLDGIPSRPHQLTFERIIKNIQSTAFLAACDANPELFEKINRECKRYEWDKYYGIDIDEWDSPTE